MVEAHRTATGTESLESMIERRLRAVSGVKRVTVKRYLDVTTEGIRLARQDVYDVEGGITRDLPDLNIEFHFVGTDKP